MSNFRFVMSTMLFLVPLLTATACGSVEERAIRACEDLTKNLEQKCSESEAWLGGDCEEDVADGLEEFPDMGEELVEMYECLADWADSACPPTPPACLANLYSGAEAD